MQLVRKRGFCLTFLLLFSLLVGCIGSSTYTVSGIIVDGEGNPLTDTKLTVTGGVSIVDAAVKDDGTFSLAKLKGSCTITPQLEGYEFLPQDAKVRGAKTELKFVGSPISIVVSSVTVQPGEVAVQKGKSQLFTAEVNGTGSYDPTVSWSVEGGGDGTDITTEGKLTIALNETASSLTVKAISNQDTTKFGTSMVMVNEVSPQVYTVSLNSDGGSQVEVQSVEHGAQASKPTDPNKEGFIFVEWQLAGEPYDFTTPVTANLILKAVWKAKTVYESTESNGFNIEVGYGTTETAANAQLAAEVAIKGTKGETGTATISWSIAGYDGSTVGEYPATGTLILPSDWIGSPADVMAVVTVSVFGGGNGSEATPYLVTNAAQLDAVRDYLDQHFKQVGEIDLSDYQNWEPIGCENESFSGFYTGDGHEIKNLTIESMNNYVGLFGRISLPAKIEGVELVDVDVSGVECVGALVGCNYTGSIENCSATGNVKGQDCVGGLVGRNDLGAIENSFVTGAVEGNKYVGGLVGNNSGPIEDCYATGTVMGYQYVGGLVGDAYDNVKGCYGAGNVEGAMWVGGLVGRNSGTIVDSHATGNVVSEKDYAGGLVGYNNGGTIENSFVTGAVEGNVYVGGLVGWNYQGTVKDSHATGDITGNGGRVGGLVGGNSGNIEGSYATGDIKGDGDNVGGLVGSSSTADIKDSYATGNVESNNNFVGGLIGYIFYGAIENCYATGVVDGNQYVGGLVGVNARTTIIDCYATGPVLGDQYVGGLVGVINSNGSIRKCYATGKVKGNSDVGGLVGKNDDGNITNSYYDKETTGKTDSGKGVSKTTAEMKAGIANDNIYTGWDTATIWTIEEGHYPWLKWQENF